MATNNEESDPVPETCASKSDEDDFFDVDAFRAVLPEDSDLKPADYISQMNGIDDDVTSVAPTLVAPSLKRSKSTPDIPSAFTSSTTNFTSTGDICFSFGPEGYYFIYVIPGQVAVREHQSGFSLRMIKENDLLQVYMQAFSPYADKFLAYEKKSTNAVTWIFHQSPINKSITYRSLRDWLVKNLNVQSTNDLLKSRVVFGGGASFYASNGTACIHHDLPTRLSGEIDRRFQDEGVLPDIISLGADDTHFARWPNSSRLGLKVKSAAFDASDLAYVFLSPVDDIRFVVVQKSGRVEYQIIDKEGTVKDHFRAYMQLKAKETGASFTMEFTSGVNLKDQEVTNISPETNYKVPQSTEKHVKAKETTRKRFSLFGKKGKS